MSGLYYNSTLHFASPHKREILIEKLITVGSFSSMAIKLMFLTMNQYDILLWPESYFGHSAGCLLALHPKHLWHPAVCPHDVGGGHGWCCGGLLHRGHLLLHCRMASVVSLSCLQCQFLVVICLVSTFCVPVSCHDFPHLFHLAKSRLNFRLFCLHAHLFVLSLGVIKISVYSVIKQ